MKKLLVLMLWAGALCACNTTTADSGNDASTQEQATIAKNVDVTQFSEHASKDDVILLDVRTPNEYENGHIHGAKNIDINSADFDEQIGNLDPSKPVYVYCRSGGRSSNAMRKMQQAGFVEIYNLNGGIIAWENAGKEVE